VEKAPSEPVKVSENVAEQQAEQPQIEQVEQPQPQPETKEEDVIEIDLDREAQELAKQMEER